MHIESVISGLSLAVILGGGDPESRTLQRRAQNTDKEQGTIWRVHPLSYEASMISSPSVRPSLCLPFLLSQNFGEVLVTR